jgi:hypothetical protein
MRYVGQKFTQAQAEQIMATARGHLREYRQHGSTDRHDDVGRYVVKTIENARIDPPIPEPEPDLLAPESDEEAGIFNVVEDVMGMAVARLQHEFEAALAKRDAEIQQLNQRFEIELALSKKLARVQREIDQARQRQPNFESELTSLREENAKQQKLISRLRGRLSQLEFQQKKLESEQQHGRQQLKVTSVELTNVSGVTRTVLERLQEEGIDLGTDCLTGLPSL